MARTAIIAEFASPDNDQRLLRLLRVHAYPLLDRAHSEIREGMRTRPRGEVFVILFGEPLEIEGCGERDVEKVVRAWLRQHYQDDLELERYESSLRSRRWLIHLKMK